MQYKWKEYKIVSLREGPMPGDLARCETPDQAESYFRAAIMNSDYFNPDAECLVVLILNARRRITGHFLVTIGTLDTLLIHPREVFRGAIIKAASAIILMHNHPSGDASPSEADIKASLDLVRAGQILKIEVLDHVIIGCATPDRKGYCSLRELGHM